MYDRDVGAVINFVKDLVGRDVNVSLDVRPRITFGPTELYDTRPELMGRSGARNMISLRLEFIIDAVDYDIPTATNPRHIMEAIEKRLENTFVVEHQRRLLKNDIERLKEQIKELEQYKSWYELSFKIRHGNLPNVQDILKRAKKYQHDKEIIDGAVGRSDGDSRTDSVLNEEGSLENSHKDYRG